MENVEKKNKTIMIVEDDSFVMDIYETKLLGEGHTVVGVSNGMEAVKKLEEGIFPDIILLDIVMPYMDGLEFLRKIRSEEKYKKIPVILLTNLSQKEDVDMGLEIGAQDYLIKSQFTPSEVFEKIKKFLE